MMTRLRRAIAITVALLLTALTFGRLRVNWTGRSGAGGPEDPGRAAVTRTHRAGGGASRR